MKKLHALIKHVQHQILAKSPASIQNPSVKEAIANILKDDHQFYMFSVIESLRAQMLLSSDKIHVDDYGTGVSGQRKIRNIASRALKSATQAQLLFRLVNHLQPTTILEMGTSLGITTLYLSKVNENCRLITLEGSSEIAETAKANFNKLKASNIELMKGDFDNTLPEALANLNPLEFCFIDGNHREKPTLKYFNLVVEQCSEAAVIVLDDIHWSAEMSHAWQRVKEHPKVWASVDLYHLGVVFLKANSTREHYKIRV